MVAQLMTQYLPTQLAAPLPPAFAQQGADAMARYLAYIQLINRYTPGEIDREGIDKLTAFGEVF